MAAVRCSRAIIIIVRASSIFYWATIVLSISQMNVVCLIEAKQKKNKKNVETLIFVPAQRTEKHNSCRTESGSYRCKNIEPFHLMWQKVQLHERHL